MWGTLAQGIEQPGLVGIELLGPATEDVVLVPEQLPAKVIHVAQQGQHHLLEHRHLFGQLLKGGLGGNPLFDHVLRHGWNSLLRSMRRRYLMSPPLSRRRDTKSHKKTSAIDPYCPGPTVVHTACVGELRPGRSPPGSTTA